MKNKIIIPLALIMLGGMVFGFGKMNTEPKVKTSGINFEHISFNEALAQAKKENKYIFMDAYATWCGPCKRLSKYTFSDASVGKEFNEKFINLKLDVDKPEGKKIANKYGISALPTLLFINGDGKVVKSSKGYIKPNQLLSLAQEIK